MWEDESRSCLTLFGPAASSQLVRRNAEKAMTKKKSKASASAAKLARDEQAHKSDPTADELDLTAILPQFALALRNTLPLASYVPSIALQFFAVAYCIFLLPGRPRSLSDPTSLLDNLIDDAPSTMKMIIGGLVVVQAYFGGQAKRWWDASQGGIRGSEETPGKDAIRKRKTTSDINKGLKEKLDVSSAALSPMCTRRDCPPSHSSKPWLHPPFSPAVSS